MYNNQDPFLGSEAVGNKNFSWKFRYGNDVLIYADGSRGPAECFSMKRSSTGAIKVKSHGNWKLTLEQHEWIHNKAFSLFKEHDNGSVEGNS